MILRRPPYRPRVCEHWIYIPHGSPPSLQVVANAYPEGSPERGILRNPSVHLGLTLRAKDPSVFRPDANCNWPDYEPGVLEEIAESSAMLRLVYADRQRPNGLGLAETVALGAKALFDACRGLAVFDPWTQRLTCSVPCDRDVLDHVRFVEQPTPRLAFRALGLGKIGWPDFVAFIASPEDRNAVAHVVQGLTGALATGERWRWAGETEGAFGTFGIKISCGRRGPANVEVRRIATS